MSEVEKLILNQISKIEAIKKYRELIGSSLPDAKDFVEFIYKKFSRS